MSAAHAVEDISPPPVDVAALRARLAEKWPHFASRARLNPHAAPGTFLHNRFASAVSRASNKHIDLYLHGTREENIDSIVQTSLTLAKTRRAAFWFTVRPETALSYTHGAKRLLVFAVLTEESRPCYNYRRVRGWSDVIACASRGC